MSVRVIFADIYLLGLRDRSMPSRTEFAREILLTDWSTAGEQWLLSIMPNRPVRDKWDYPKKMERHFPIKPRQPIGIALVTILSFPNSLIRAKNRFVKNGISIGIFQPK